MEEHVVAKPHPSATSASTFADRPSYKWWVTWTIMVGSFLFALDTTIVNIAMGGYGTLLGHFWRSRPLVSPITKGDTSNGNHRTTHQQRRPPGLPRQSQTEGPPTADRDLHKAL